jgi:hypothetical protein
MLDLFFEGKGGIGEKREDERRYIRREEKMY